MMQKDKYTKARRSNQAASDADISGLQGYHFLLSSDNANINRLLIINFSRLDKVWRPSASVSLLFGVVRE